MNNQTIRKIVNEFLNEHPEFKDNVIITPEGQISIDKIPGNLTRDVILKFLQSDAEGVTLTAQCDEHQHSLVFPK